MLKQKDLEAAISAGIISEEQADQLNDFAASRRKARGFAAGRDERFRLLGGFNDFFVAIGVVLLALGVWFGASNFKEPAAYIVGIFIMWGLAEYLTARMRLTAPSIVISIFLAIFAFLAAKGHVPLDGQLPDFTRRLIAPSCALVMSALFYLRFRLPFALTVIAVTSLILLLSVFGFSFDGSDASRNQAIVFGFGLVLFAIAMWFDSSDTERLTRRADKGFWLHLVAAPMIVHPLVTNLARGGASSDGLAAMIVVAISALLALVALVIDRRALVVVSLSYLGAAIAYGVSELSGSTESSTNATFTLLFLGSIIVALGVGWHPIRGTLMRALPNFTLKQKLPPIKETT